MFSCFSELNLRSFKTKTTKLLITVIKAQLRKTKNTIHHFVNGFPHVQCEIPSALQNTRKEVQRWSYGMGNKSVLWVITTLTEDYQNDIKSNIFGEKKNKNVIVHLIS